MSREEYLKEQITKIQNDFDKLAQEIQDDGNACTKTMFSEYVAFELEKAFKDFDNKQIQDLKAENTELKARLELYTEAINLSIIECNELAKYDQCDTRYETVQELLEQAEAKLKEMEGK